MAERLVNISLMAAATSMTTPMTRGAIVCGVDPETNIGTNTMEENDFTYNLFHCS